MPGGSWRPARCVRGSHLGRGDGRLAERTVVSHGAAWHCGAVVTGKREALAGAASEGDRAGQVRKKRVPLKKAISHSVNRLPGKGSPSHPEGTEVKIERPAIRDPGAELLLARRPSRSVPTQRPGFQRVPQTRAVTCSTDMGEVPFPLQPRRPGSSSAAPSISGGDGPYSHPPTLLSHQTNGAWEVTSVTWVSLRPSLCLFKKIEIQ